MADRSMWDRMKGAAMLDVATYEEVEHDETLTTQAAIVVLIAALARGIGGFGDGENGIIVGIVAALFSWLVWAGITYLIGDKLLKGTATWGELLRTLGYAQAPAVLLILGFVPVLGGVIGAIVGIWLLVTGIVAIRQALDFDTGKAILTAFLGWLVAVAIPALVIGASLIDW
ncbi:MAG: YIP1 family protein [Gemmatimonadetes bacterium]|nr:YIP1 family protein [Gemmatimonadota bacterium]NNK62922.1 YIP1 family protein [Gemmatimonadota bacterium]